MHNTSDSDLEKQILELLDNASRDKSTGLVEVRVISKQLNRNCNDIHAILDKLTSDGLVSLMQSTRGPRNYFHYKITQLGQTRLVAKKPSVSRGNIEKPYVFLSYSRQDMSIVERVYERLNNFGINVWMDREQMVAGRTESWTSEIEVSIDEACGVVAILSPSARNSEWVRKELHYAKCQKTDIFPLLGVGDEKTSCPLLLSGAQFIDIQVDFETGMAKLVELLNQHIAQL